MRKPAEFEEHPVPFEAPVYRAVVKHVTDGDTVDVFLDLGLYQYAYETIRLAGIDTPEIYRPNSDVELEMGQKAKARVEALVLGQPVKLRTERDRTSFGRFVGHIEYRDEGGEWRDLAETLRDEGFDWGGG